MINFLIIILIFIIFILFQLYEIPKGVGIVINGLLISSICYYIGINVEDNYISKIFMILSFITIFIMLTLIIVHYIEKLKIK